MRTSLRSLKLIPVLLAALLAWPRDAAPGPIGERSTAEVGGRPATPSARKVTPRADEAAVISAADELDEADPVDESTAPSVYAPSSWGPGLRRPPAADGPLAGPVGPGRAPWPSRCVRLRC